MRGIASDVEGTFSATINWNTVSDKSMVIPTMDMQRVRGLDTALFLLKSLCRMFDILPLFLGYFYRPVFRR